MLDGGAKNPGVPAAVTCSDDDDDLTGPGRSCEPDGVTPPPPLLSAGSGGRTGTPGATLINPPGDFTRGDALQTRRPEVSSCPLYLRLLFQTSLGCFSAQE